MNEYKLGNCAEVHVVNQALKLNYNVNEWKPVLEYLWEFTSIEYLDDWNDIVAEIMPENLLEFRTYEEHEFEVLDEENFKYLYNLYQNTKFMNSYLLHYGEDVGIQQGQFKILEEIDSRLEEGVRWEKIKEIEEEKYAYKNCLRVYNWDILKIYQLLWKTLE